MAAAHPAVRVAHVRDGRPATGTAVLVDRLWPRGQSKAAAPWDVWLRDVAPSTDLRRWYGHDPDRHAEFVRRYRAELGGGEQAAALARLRALLAAGPLTLMTASRDLALSQAAVLADLLGADA
ncbi:DUF488 domain-containing protein [Nocardioides sp. L-11A]|uniref:DUF488 domain-containing protein n=1 Tax=Nocardioides sp. L-11A TaxID=3043848 RepID=UPI00249BAB35|nr:DUF488 family protein [Nocardioides sp. L-11A]